MSLHSRWTAHLKSPEEKEKFKRSLYTDLTGVDRLRAIIEDFLRELDSLDLSTEEYDKPGFPYLKADRNGEKRAYLRIKQLLDSVKE